MVTTGEVEKRLRIIIEAQDQTQAKFNSVSERIRKLSHVSRVNRIYGFGQTEDQKMAIENLKRTADVQRGILARNKIMINQNQRLLKGARQFKMEYLGIMFAGMQLQRVTTGFLRSAINAYNEAFEETSALEQQTNKLTSAWKFFQFQLMDALAQSPLLKNFVEFVAGLADKFSNLSAEARLKIVVGAATAALTGSIMFMIGATVLASSSLAQAFGFVGPGASLGALAVVATASLLVTDMVGNIATGQMEKAIEDAVGLVGVAFIAKGKFKAGAIILTIPMILRFREEIEERLKSVGERIEGIADKHREASEKSIGWWDKFSEQSLAQTQRQKADIFNNIATVIGWVNSGIDELGKIFVKSEEVTNQKTQNVTTSFANMSASAVTDVKKVETEWETLRNSADINKTFTVTTINRMVYEDVGASAAQQTP